MGAGGKLTWTDGYQRTWTPKIADCFKVKKQCDERRGGQYYSHLLRQLQPKEALEYTDGKTLNDLTEPSHARTLFVVGSLHRYP